MTRIWLILLTQLLPASANYALPDNNVSLIRLERLPLDISHLKKLEQDLITLGFRHDCLDSPAARQTTCQLLFLATQLNPSRDSPNLIHKKLLEDPLQREWDSQRLQATLENIETITTFLLSQSSHPEGKKLAHLLLDPYATLKPESELAALRKKSSIKKRWQNAIPPISAFKDLPPEQTEATLPNPSAPLVEEEITEETPSPIPPRFNSLVSFPGFIEVESSPARPRQKRSQIVSLNLSTKPHEKGFLRLEIRPANQPPILSEIRDIALTNIRNFHDPELLKNTYGMSGLSFQSYYNSRNQFSLALPLALTLHSCLTAQEISSDWILCADLDKQGKLSVSPNITQYLDILAKESPPQPRRVLVSKTIEPYLLACLIQKQDQLFLDFEFISCSKIDQAIKLVVENNASPSTLSAQKQFAEIRRVAEGKSLGAFVTNSHVLSRLQQVANDDPNHLSARLLAIRGSNSYPSKFETEVLAAHLTTRLYPLKRLPYLQTRQLEETAFNSIHQTIRDDIDPLEKFVALNDRELYQKTLSVVNLLRTMGREQQRNDTAKFRATYTKFQIETFDLTSKFAELLNQPAPKTPPAVSLLERRREKL
ncbi:MAG: hypothetical protein AAGC74_03930 [Verrucomicrobiota bacterium]